MQLERDGGTALDGRGMCPMQTAWPVALTVAGSDSGGGAGIQADLKTFFALGVHGTCAVTSVTSQNTMGVSSRYDLPPEVVVSQIQAVLEDFDVAAAKTGMLGNAVLVEAVAGILRERGIRNLVVDPVALSSSGHLLLEGGGLEALASELLPLATVFTPNLQEASLLLGREVEGREGMREAAARLMELGPACVVVKGGHLAAGDALDVFYDGGDMVELSLPRVETADDHGTGCVFSAAVAARLARGEGPVSAVRGAKEDVTMALRRSLRLGKGRGPVNPASR